MNIAIYGKLRAGKSAVCEYIAENYECEVLEFSGALQEAINVMYPNKKGIKDRELLISVGQHMRKLDEDVWVNIVRHKIENSTKPHILVAGVRQANEFKMLKELGFTFIKVDASESVRVQRCIENGDKFNKESLKNSTETIMDNYDPDYLILNEYGFKELEISIRNVLDDILRKEMLDKEMLDECIMSLIFQEDDESFDEALKEVYREEMDEFYRITQEAFVDYMEEMEVEKDARD